MAKKKQTKKRVVNFILLLCGGLGLFAVVALGIFLRNANRDVAYHSSQGRELSLNLLSLRSELKECLNQLSECQTESIPKVEILPTPEGGYLMKVRGEPFFIKGVAYSPVPIGEGYDWDFFADPANPWRVDGKMMKEAGFNAVRIYAPGEDLEQVGNFIDYMYENFGIYTIMGDWLGLWERPSANYSDAKFRENTKNRVIEMVSALKDRQGLLMWVLGNENNYTFSGQIGFWTCPEIEELECPREKQNARAEIYYSFIAELTDAIKEIDPVHPVALGNGETSFLNIAAEICDNIDVLGLIVYRGKAFGNFFNSVKNLFDKPVVLTEFGCDSFDAFRGQPDEDIQAEFILSQWRDLYDNTVFRTPEGNALGGCIFEWNDEWWKHNEGYRPGWHVHDRAAGWSHGSYYFDIRAPEGMNMNEEWFGIVSLEPEIKDGINIRQPKKSYYYIKEFFKSIKRNKPVTEY